MRPSRILVIASLVVLAACTQHKTEEQSSQESSPAAAPAEPHPADQGALSCDYPVKHDATAEQLLAKYGDDAVVGLVETPDAGTTNGVILWRGYPKQRIEITFWDKEQTHIRAVRLGQEATAWKGPSGLHYGSSIEDVASANGAFALERYNWDDGGYLGDLGDGRLAKLPGGCGLSVRLAPQADKRHDAPYNDDGFDWNDDRVAGLGLTVSRMEIDWPKS
ncbi:hypothetical protein [Asticcacaulis solisilvae]|uniref:hypothetical protein n=1 Tax=Asticcacaulis solisilvae TaxID=1217274 RepID=UPI003FD879FE